MRTRALVAIVVIDTVIALLGVVIMSFEQPDDLTVPLAITIASMTALTLGVVWGEARAGYIPALKKYVVPLFIAFVLIGLYAAIMADGSDILDALKVLLLSTLTIGAGILAFVFVASNLVDALEQHEAPEWAQALIPPLVGMATWLVVQFGSIYLAMEVLNI